MRIIEQTDNWLNCPTCNSDQIEGFSISIEGKHAWQRVGCLDCDETWIEVYEALHREVEGYDTHLPVRIWGNNDEKQRCTHYTQGKNRCSRTDGHKLAHIYYRATFT